MMSQFVRACPTVLLNKAAITHVRYATNGFNVGVHMTNGVLVTFNFKNNDERARWMQRVFKVDAVTKTPPYKRDIFVV